MASQAPASPRVELFFDFISPYAYLAFSRLGALRAHSEGLRLTLTPVLFAGLLAKTGQLGPAEIPAKREWVGRDILRKASALGVELEAPLFHPFNPLLALRAVTALDDMAERERAAGAIFRGVWATKQHVSDARVLAALLDEALGEGRSADVLARAADDATKQALRAATERACDLGVFGVPSFVVDGVEGVFWGVDDIEHVMRAMGGDDGVDPERFEAWKTVTPSAVRKR